MAGTIYNTEVLELSKKVPEALTEVETLCKKGYTAVRDGAEVIGSPKFTAVAQELETNAVAFLKVVAELAEHTANYNKTYSIIEDSF